MRVFSDSTLGQYILACLAAAMDKPAPNERQKPAAHARIRYRAYVCFSQQRQEIINGARLLERAV